MARQAFLAPEILQISSIDCGVAALSCMLSGFGIDANYQKLREACQTNVDGTSIDSLEDICVDLGLDACQHVIPQDLMVDAMESRMPMIAIVEPSPAVLHFVTVWRRVGPWLQVMDPRGGRVWKRVDALTGSLFPHTQQISMEQWHDWFPSSAFHAALQQTARSLLSSNVTATVCDPVLNAANPREVGALDAALRVVKKTEQFAPKSTAWRDGLFQRVFSAALTAGEQAIPKQLWSLSSDEEDVYLKGVVVLAPRDAKSAEHGQAAPASPRMSLGTRVKPSLLRSVLNVMGPDARNLIFAMVLGTVAVAIASAVEVMLYRVALDLPRLITTFGTRVGAVLAFATLIAILLGLEATLAYGGNRLGRTLEMKLRMKTLWSIPRVDDDFVKSRPTSDLAYRAQALSMGSLLVPTLFSMAGAVGDLTVTLGAMAILDIRYAAIAATVSLLFVASWLARRSKLQEVDSRLQVHAGRLLSIFLDAMRGIRPVRLHGFQDAFRDEQRREIEQWRVSARAQIEATSLLQILYTLSGVLLVSGIFAVFLHRHGDARQFVVLAFWSFRIPPTVRRLVQFAQTYPLQRNAVDRLLEVTEYVDQSSAEDNDERDGRNDNPAGVSIRLNDVSVVLRGHTVLEEINLDIPAGQHIAVVGASGSGKSTLVSVLLGLNMPSEGQLLIDGRPLDEQSRQALRASTMWIDPAVQLWNESLSFNLDYAVRGYQRRPALEVLESSDLLGVLASVDRGLDAPLGAEGAFVSGGEGQRIRVGRAMFRSGTRLALLDEPFRGLDRSTRQQILLQVRRAAIRATMIFVSHDISHALSFERVLVVDEGRIVEDGSPLELSSQDSVFARLLSAEKEVLESAWNGRRWRRLRVERGKVQEVDTRA